MVRQRPCDFLCMFLPRSFWSLTKDSGYTSTFDICGLITFRWVFSLEEEAKVQGGKFTIQGTQPKLDLNPGLPDSETILFFSFLGSCLLISRMKRLFKIKAFQTFHFKAGKTLFTAEPLLVQPIKKDERETSLSKEGQAACSSTPSPMAHRHLAGILRFGGAFGKHQPRSSQGLLKSL